MQKVGFWIKVVASPDFRKGESGAEVSGFPSLSSGFQTQERVLGSSAFEALKLCTLETHNRPAVMLYPFQ
jgi:hypothetical protein